MTTKYISEEFYSLTIPTYYPLSEQAPMTCIDRLISTFIILIYTQKSYLPCEEEVCQILIIT